MNSRTVIEIGASEKVCGTCRYWEGAREPLEAGGFLCVEQMDGFCRMRLGNPDPPHFLNAITRPHSNVNCHSWATP